MSRIIKIFPSPYLVAESIANEIVNKITVAEGRKQPFTIALSGGNSPLILFSIIGDHFSAAADWRRVHFFWVDERCVPPDDPDSNFRMAKITFLDKIEIPDKNIHRIRGENEPAHEIMRYSQELKIFTEETNGLPAIDIMILGMGEDGHVASIFPGNEFLFSSDDLCYSTIHPSTGQKRITISGRVINNARNIYFVITGLKKASMVKNILGNDSPEKIFPASYVISETGMTLWYIDNEAGSMIGDKINS
jgi:6-phosphogluconolactonase